jgi:ankyrin repeat protein
VLEISREVPVPVRAVSDESQGPDLPVLAFASRGADVALADADGRAPLHWAAHNDEEGVLRLLLAASGVDRAATDARGQTALDLALENDAAAAAALLQGMQP